MTDTSNSDLMLAILAMDAYNRGYNASIDLDKTKQIGLATVASDSSDKFSVGPTQASGFYAVEYTWNGKTVISYRGTDNQSFFADPVKGASDVWSGWTIGAGYANASQATWAEKFYKAVTNQSVWADTAPSNVVLTGHSLGGGLAEYVGTTGLSTQGGDHSRPPRRLPRPPHGCDGRVRLWRHFRRRGIESARSHPSCFRLMVMPRYVGGRAR